MKRKARIQPINFELNVDGKPLEVVAQPYIAANKKQRFRVSYNGSPIHIFGLDESDHTIEVLDSASETIPPKIVHAIADTLLQKIAA